MEPSAKVVRDWRKPEDYEFTNERFRGKEEHLNALEWTWQFLRRNPLYKQQCDEYIEATRAKGRDLSWFGPFSEEGWQLNEFALSTVGDLPILDTTIEFPNWQVLHSTFSSWFRTFAQVDGADVYDPSSYVQRLWLPHSPYVGTFRFFLEFDLAPQFAWVRESLFSIQRRRSVLALGRLPRRLEWGLAPRNREKLTLYLRALDAFAAGATPAEIGRGLFPSLLDGMPERPAKYYRNNQGIRERQREDARRRRRVLRMAWDRGVHALEKGQELSAEPWVILLSNPP